LKDSCNDDQHESEIKDDGRHPFFVDFLNNNNLVRLSIKPRWGPLLELSSEISEIPQQEIKDLLDAITSNFEWEDIYRFKPLRFEERETRETEVSHISSYSFDFILTTIRYCRFLEAKYQNLICSFMIGGFLKKFVVIHRLQ